jgi:riboflavin synthase
MFTGIVEEIGTVSSIERRGDGRRLVVSADAITGDMELGASVALNGCCLTVVDFGDGWWATEAVPETLARTNIGDLVVGSEVNLERPMRADGRFGGHIVQGHVDGVARVASTTELDDGSHVVGFALDSRQLPYVVEKGSITVDGVSLTVAAVTPDGFEIAVIPHTWTATRFGSYEVGTAVNIELDIVAKYVERLLAARHDLVSTAEAT